MMGIGDGDYQFGFMNQLSIHFNYQHIDKGQWLECLQWLQNNCQWNTDCVKKGDIYDQLWHCSSQLKGEF